MNCRGKETKWGSLKTKWKPQKWTLKLDLTLLKLFWSETKNEESIRRSRDQRVERTLWKVLLSWTLKGNLLDQERLQRNKNRDWKSESIGSIWEAYDWYFLKQELNLSHVA